MSAGDKDWLEARKSGIGGTDAAAICGLSPWRKPIDVFNEKAGIIDAPPRETMAMRVGKMTEPIIKKLFEEHTEFRVTPNRRNTLLRCKAHPFLIGTPDGIVRSEKAIWEAKMVTSHGERRWRVNGTLEVPPDYKLQVHWYMFLRRWRKAFVAALFGGYEFRVFEIDFDAEFFGDTVQRCVSFWTDHVIQKVPPAMDGSDGCDAYLAVKLRGERKNFRQSTPEEAELIRIALDAKRRADEAMRVEREAKQKIMIGLGSDYAGIEAGDITAKLVVVSESSSPDYKTIASKAIPLQELMKLEYENRTTRKGHTRLSIIGDEGEGNA